MKVVPVAPLRRLMCRALTRRGLTAEHAADVVDGLLQASLRGTDTHGVRLLPTYLRELDGGRAKARPEMRWYDRRWQHHQSADPPAARLLDAGHALGPVAGMTAAREAVRLAGEHGVGVVAVKNSNYFGASAQYTLEIAHHDMIGVCCTNSDALVAPIGGGRPFFGTNPLSFAACGAGDDVFSVDMATSQASFTRVKQRRERGEPLEPGWAVGPDGRDASSPDVAEVTALLPLGGHKGQCLAMMVEILCSLLAGMPFDHQLTHFYDEPFDTPRLTSHLFLALDVGAFQPVEAFKARLSQLLALVRAEGEVSGQRVVAPGDLEAATRREREQSGVPLADEDLAALYRIDEEAPPPEREAL